MSNSRSDSNSVVDGCSSQPNYSAIELPSKSCTEYDWRERRAEVLQNVKEAGTPSAVNQTQLGEQYGVTQQQISKDLDRIAEHVHHEVVDRDRRVFTINTILERCVNGLLDEEEYRAAARAAIDWDEWLTDFHDMNELFEKLDRIEQQQNRRQERDHRL